MPFYLTHNENSIKKILRLSWLPENAHRIISLRLLKFNSTKGGKLIAVMKDNQEFHADFLSHSSMIAWLFHPEFAGLPMGVFGFSTDDSMKDWNEMQLDGTRWITAGSPEHWDLISQCMGK